MRAIVVSCVRGALGVALLCGVAGAGAQDVMVPISITVLDVAGRSVAGAQISVKKSLNGVVSTLVSDSSGFGVARVASSLDNVEVDVRRLGYLPSSHFVSVVDARPVALRVTLTAQPAQLAGMNVTAEQSAKKRELTIDADAIAANANRVLDGLDVVLKLRPQMVYGLSGRLGGCGAARFIWVNGKHIVYAPEHLMTAQRRREFESAGFKIPPPLLALSSDVVAVMSTIKPEHIEKVEMHDCTDETFDDRVNDRPAIFVTLKTGLAYEAGVGSYVVSAAAQDSLLRRIVRQPPVQRASAEVYSRPAVIRLIGLYDAETGAPIAAADVTDVASGAHVATTETGTASIGFIVAKPALVLLSKPGYATDTLRLSADARDTMPITALLRKRP